MITKIERKNQLPAENIIKKISASRNINDKAKANWKEIE